MTIHDILVAVESRRVRITDHADDEASADSLTIDDIFSSLQHAEVIEEYPNDLPYPSCLILSRTSDESPIHSVWAYNELSRWAVLVTVYRPDPARWVEWRKRRKSE